MAALGRRGRSAGGIHHSGDDSCTSEFDHIKDIPKATLSVLVAAKVVIRKSQTNFRHTVEAADGFHNQYCKRSPLDDITYVAKKIQFSD